MKADPNGAEDVCKWEKSNKYHVDDDHEADFMA
jgi:hypothetical protein